METNQDNLWPQVLKAKYGTDISKRKSLKSFTYKGIQKTLPIYRSCIRKKIGDGKNINLWCDTWLGQTLRKSIVGPLPQSEDEIKVSSIIKRISNNNVWHFDDLPFQLLEKQIMEIKSQPLVQGILPPNDQTIWKLTENGSFSSKSAYLWLHDLSKNTSERRLDQVNRNFLNS